MVALLIALSYLVGSIPVGVMVGRMRGFDPRKVGSGNVGMTNVARAGGRAAAALTFAGDLLKGLIPVLVARAVGFGPSALALVALAALLGSLYSVFLKFEGGRGVSTTVGAWLAIGPMALAVAVGVFVVVFAARWIVSLASISAAVTLPVAVALMSYPRAYRILAFAMSALVIWRHRANIGRLLRGEEPSVALRRKAPGESAV